MMPRFRYILKCSSSIVAFMTKDFGPDKVILQVTLLESRNRIGGRVHTDYSFGFPIDLGASW